MLTKVGLGNYLGRIFGTPQFAEKPVGLKVIKLLNSLLVAASLGLPVVAVVAAAGCADSWLEAFLNQDAEALYPPAEPQVEPAPQKRAAGPPVDIDILRGGDVGGDLDSVLEQVRGVGIAKGGEGGVLKKTVDTPAGRVREVQPSQDELLQDAWRAVKAYRKTYPPERTAGYYNSVLDQIDRVQDPRQRERLREKLGRRPEPQPPRPVGEEGPVVSYGSKTLIIDQGERLIPASFDNSMPPPHDAGVLPFDFESAPRKNAPEDAALENPFQPRKSADRPNKAPASRAPIIQPRAGTVLHVRWPATFSFNGRYTLEFQVQGNVSAKNAPRVGFLAFTKREGCNHLAWGYHSSNKSMMEWSRRYYGDSDTTWFILRFNPMHSISSDYCKVKVSVGDWGKIYPANRLR